MKKYDIEVIEYLSDFEIGFAVRINGTKFPKEVGQLYITTTEENAVMFALAEHAGKYLSRGGVVYDSREDYLKTIEAY